MRSLPPGGADGARSRRVKIEGKKKEKTNQAQQKRWRSFFYFFSRMHRIDLPRNGSMAQCTRYWKGEPKLDVFFIPSVSQENVSEPSILISKSSSELLRQANIDELIDSRE
mmetsp:Transcript_25318/g.53998  ORF Transcript_25318/g.53998 Transcript_25318/m.53998 type:complete len:111 (+) Transcript_25318:1278-1610(+)